MSDLIPQLNALADKLRIGCSSLVQVSEGDPELVAIERAVQTLKCQRPIPVSDRTTELRSLGLTLYGLFPDATLVHVWHENSQGFSLLRYGERMNDEGDQEPELSWCCEVARDGRNLFGGTGWKSPESLLSNAKRSTTDK